MGNVVIRLATEHKRREVDLNWADQEIAIPRPRPAAPRITLLIVDRNSRLVLFRQKIASVDR